MSHLSKLIHTVLMDGYLSLAREQRLRELLPISDTEDDLESLRTLYQALHRGSIKREAYRSCALPPREPSQ